MTGDSSRAQTNGGVPPFLTETALVAFVSIVGQVFREIGTLPADARADQTIVRERLRYLVHMACGPWQPHPLTPDDVDSLKRLLALLLQVLDSPEEPLLPL